MIFRFLCVLLPGFSQKQMPYLEHLSKDKKLQKLIAIQGKHKIQKHKNVCLRLCASIMSQQLSTKVAAVIYKRFIDLFDGNEPQPADILAISTEQLRAIGLSNAKVSYMHHVARFALEKGLDAGKLGKMKEDEIISYLTEIKGVGRWTAEMIMMFTLGKTDVFAMDDLGLQQSIVKLYNLDPSDKKKFRERTLSISQKWSPYRTYACLYLWRWKDEKKEIAPSKTKKR